jgi:hypothetical protein
MCAAHLPCAKQERYGSSLLYYPLCQTATLFCTLPSPVHLKIPGDEMTPECEMDGAFNAGGF